MKFKFGDEVKVIDGFYVGMNGRVDEYSEITDTYYVDLYSVLDNKFRTINREVKEEYLEKI